MGTQGTCLSDFHEMTFAVLKMHFEKPKSKIVICRDNRNFCWRDFSRRHPFSMYETFSEKSENFSPSDIHFTYVLNGPSSILENHAPLKK